MAGIYCRHCGYDLRSTAEATCPECGKAFNKNQRSTVAISPSEWRDRQIQKRSIIATIIAAIAVIILIIGIYYRNVANFYIKGFGLKNGEIKQLHGYSDLGIKVHTVVIDVLGKGEVAISTNNDNSIFSHTNSIEIIQIGPYRIEDIYDKLIASGSLTQSQKQSLHKTSGYSINVGSSGEFSDFSSNELTSVQDVINNYDDIINAISLLLSQRTEKGAAADDPGGA